MLCQNQVNDALLIETLLGFHSDTKTWLVMQVHATHTESLTLVLVHISSFYNTTYEFKIFISDLLPH